MFIVQLPFPAHYIKSTKGQINCLPRGNYVQIHKLVVVKEKPRSIIKDSPCLWECTQIGVWSCYRMIRRLKGPRPIFNFFQTFGDFGITRNLIFFLYITYVKFHSWKCSFWKIIMKMCLAIKLTQKDIDSNNVLNCFAHPKDSTVSNEMLDLHLWSDCSSNKTEN